MEIEEVKIVEDLG